MFDKDLFLLLCEKYDVELSENATSPMVRDGMGVHAITSDDMKRIFSPCQTYFAYSGNMISANHIVPEFYLMEDYAIAC